MKVIMEHEPGVFGRSPCCGADLYEDQEIVDNSRLPYVWGPVIGRCAACGKTYPPRAALPFRNGTYFKNKK
jgi:hypothetical protein